MSFRPKIQHGNFHCDLSYNLCLFRKRMQENFVRFTTVRIRFRSALFVILSASKRLLNAFRGVALAVLKNTFA